RRSLAVRAADVRAGGRRGRPRPRGVRSGLLPARARPLSRDNGDEAVARHAQEPQAAQAERTVSRCEYQALLQARHRAPGSAIRSEAGQLTVMGDGLEPVTGAGVHLGSAGAPVPRDERVGEVYLSAEEIATRVAELGADVEADYKGREPLLVASLKASFVFLGDLTTRVPILHPGGLRA